MHVPLLRLKNIAKFYGARPVFRKVSLELRTGEILLLGGPNGSGKSTLLRLIAGLSRPSAGQLELNLSPGARLGYMAHQTALYPQLTARENLLFWSRLFKVSPTESSLRDALQRVGLERLALEKAGIFSRGQAQRLSLARLLLLEPALLLLDEPDSGLDEKARELLEREIAAAAERGAAVIRVSHHLAGPALAGPIQTGQLQPEQPKPGQLQPEQPKPGQPQPEQPKPGQPRARRAELRPGQGLLFFEPPTAAAGGAEMRAAAPC